MILLFLRPIAVTPMGPNPLPGLAEDEEARATFDRVGWEAGRVGVPMRTIYETTERPPGDHRRGRPRLRGGRGGRRVVPGGPHLPAPARDPTPSLIRLLPERTSLLIHASRAIRSGLHFGCFLPMKTRFVGASSSTSTGIFIVEAKTEADPPATHSLRLTVVNSALLWTSIT